MRNLLFVAISEHISVTFNLREKGSEHVEKKAGTVDWASCHSIVLADFCSKSKFSYISCTVLVCRRYLSTGMPLTNIQSCPGKIRPVDSNAHRSI